MPGPSHAPFRALLRAFALGVLMAAPLASLTACDAVEGTTPQCEPNVDSNGIHPSENGCEQFAVCRDENGNPQDPKTFCCKDLTGLDQDYCVYTYGGGEPPYKGGGSSTSGTGGSGGGSGTGGSGGAPAN